MAIKVVKEGVLPKKRPPDKYSITCEHCSAVFEIDENDWNKANIKASSFREEDWGSSDFILCPTQGCGNRLTRYGKTTKRL